MKRCLFHRILTLTLALLMVCSQFCASNVFAQGIDEEIYRANVGGTAKLNDTTIYISDNPVSSTKFFEHTLKPDTIAANADTVFAIVDCYVDNNGYWYKLAATAGQTLPEELAAKPWVYQNDIPLEHICYQLRLRVHRVKVFLYQKKFLLFLALNKGLY